MDKKIIYSIIASIVVFSFGMTMYIYWQQQQSPKDLETYQQGPIDENTASFRFGEADLIVGETSQIPIYLDINGNENVTSVDLEMNYSTDADVNITITPGTVFNSYPIREINGSNIKIYAEDSNGITPQNNILFATLNITPNTSGFLTINFEFNQGDTTDTNVTTSNGRDILSNVDSGSFMIDMINDINSQTQGTVLYFEEKDLTKGDLQTIAIYVNSNQKYNSVDAVINYDTSFLNINNYQEGDFDSYFINVKEDTSQVELNVSSTAELTGQNIVAYLEVTPLKEGNTSLNLEFNQGQTTDSNVNTPTGEDILTGVINQEYNINDTGIGGNSLVACYNQCDTDSDCEGTLECLNINGQNRCINPECEAEIDCICDINNDSNSSSNSSINSNNKDSSNSNINNTKLPQAGNEMLTVLAVIMGLLILSGGILLKKTIY